MRVVVVLGQKLCHQRSEFFQRLHWGRWRAVGWSAGCQASPLPRRLRRHPLTPPPPPSAAPPPLSWPKARRGEGVGGGVRLPLKFGLFGAAARKSPKSAPAGQKEHKEIVFRCGGFAAATKNNHLCGHIDSPLLGRESGQVGRIANLTYLQGNSGQKAKVQGGGRGRGEAPPPPSAAGGGVRYPSCPSG